MRKKILVIALLLLSGLHLCTGQVIYSVAALDIPTSARTAALGMRFLSLTDHDASLLLDNPALSDARFHGHFGFTYTGLFAGAHAGALYLSHHTQRIGDLTYGIRFYTYGTFEGYDETETATGAFRAADYILHIGWGMHIDSAFSIGVAAKPILSSYENFSAMAIAIDVVGCYQSPSRLLSLSVAGRNIGAQFTTFDQEVEKLPFHLDAVASYRLREAPFRLYVQAADLQRWNLAYYDTLSPTTLYDPYTGTSSAPSTWQKFSDNLFRHLNAAVELCIAEKFYARVGYSYRQTKEMSVTGRSHLNTSGFSYGLGVRTRRLEFGYARNNYHLGQSPNWLTLNFRF